jgi:hypothetical protein
MKQFLASALVLGLFSLASVGCVEKSSTTKETEVSTSAGTVPVSGQQQRLFDAQQQGGSKVREQSDTIGQQQGSFKEEERSGPDGRQEGGSKNQKQSGTDGQPKGAAQSQTTDDVKKKETK